MIDITPLLNALIAVAAVLITAFLIPWIKSRTTTAQREDINAQVKIGCAAAEQLYNSGQIQNKKAYVLQFLAQKKLKVNTDELDKMIEAAVLEINKEWADNEATNRDAILETEQDENEETEPEQRMEVATMQTRQAGVDLIKRFEGCRLTAYKPVAAEQYYTIVYGHYGADVKKGQTITQAQAEKLLKTDLVRYENYVKQYVKFGVNQNQFDALVSFCYNCGVRSLQTLVRNRQPATVAEKMLLYNKDASGKVLTGLTRRQQTERKLFLTPVQKQEVDDEMVQNGKIIVNGKEVSVHLILKDGTNYIKIRDVGDALGYTVSANGSTPVLTKK